MFARISAPSQRTLLLRRLQDVNTDLHVCYQSILLDRSNTRRPMEEDSEQNVVNSIQADEETKTTQRDADGSGGDVSDTRMQ